MYSLPAYGQMVGDDARFAAYRNALERAIEPESVVVDLGAGPGVFALLAARAGARRVFAVESEATVEWLHALARDNGVADRVTVIRGRSEDVSLDEPAHVLVSDLRGVLPFFGRHLPALIDARSRWLAPGGRLIARADELWAAPVRAESWYRRQAAGFEGRGSSEGPALDLEVLRRAATNHWCRADLDPDACLAEPVRLGRVDYATVSSPDLRAELAPTVEQSGPCHGLAVWFDSELDDRERLSNRPSARSPLYGQAFFPWSRPLELEPGDRLELDFEARLMEEDYVFRWRCRQLRGARELRREDQSTFYGAPLGAADLPRKLPTDERSC